MDGVGTVAKQRICPLPEDSRQDPFPQTRVAAAYTQAFKTELGFDHPKYTLRDIIFHQHEEALKQQHCLLLCALL